ncbi:hypothetical protein Gotur_007440 [Gossypium turneri]
MRFENSINSKIFYSIRFDRNYLSLIKILKKLKIQLEF